MSISPRRTGPRSDAAIEEHFVDEREDERLADADDIEREDERDEDEHVFACGPASPVTSSPTTDLPPAARSMAATAGLVVDDLIVTPA